MPVKSYRNRETDNACKFYSVLNIIYLVQVNILYHSSSVRTYTISQSTNSANWNWWVHGLWLVDTYLPASTFRVFFSSVEVSKHFCVCVICQFNSNRNELSQLLPNAITLCELNIFFSFDEQLLKNELRVQCDLLCHCLLDLVVLWMEHLYVCRVLSNLYHRFFYSVHRPNKIIWPDIFRSFVCFFSTPSLSLFAVTVVVVEIDQSHEKKNIIWWRRKKSQNTFTRKRTHSHCCFAFADWPIRNLFFFIVIKKSVSKKEYVKADPIPKGKT